MPSAKMGTTKKFQGLETFRMKCRNKSVSWCLFTLLVFLICQSVTSSSTASGPARIQTRRARAPYVHISRNVFNFTNESTTLESNNNATTSEDNVVVSVTNDTDSTGGLSATRKREIGQLPLEKLFFKKVILNEYPTSSSTEAPLIIENESSTPNEIKNGTNPEKMIREAFLNHTLNHGTDEELDRIVFSQLPEGSKLILRTVKLVATDENGDTVEDTGNGTMVWDMTLANATDQIYDSEEEAEVEEHDDDEEEEEEEDAEGDKDDKVGKGDLEGAGSQAHAAHATVGYKSKVTHGRKKQKDNKYHHGKDHGKSHKVTNTDTVGGEKTHYGGKEHGITDYDNAHGKSQTAEGGRYKDSKKKNKGRKVTGFKRVYHKEEYQRTEHFYDDEEAKRIAESFGLHDAKKEADLGKKDDDRKYHGIKKEHTVGDKVKNEVAVKNGYSKGAHTGHKDSELHKHTQHQTKEQHSKYGHPNSYYHPNHNYKGSYSNTSPVLRSPIAESSDSILESPVLPIPSPSAESLTGKEDTSFKNASRLDTESDDEDDEDTPIGLNPPAPPPMMPIGISSTTHFPALPLLKKPDEMKVFFSPRQRAPEEANIDNAPNSPASPYAPNFSPQKNPKYPKYQTSHYRPPANRYKGKNGLRFLTGPFYPKLGNVTDKNTRPSGGSVIFPQTGPSNDSDSYTVDLEDSHKSPTGSSEFASKDIFKDLVIDPVPSVYSTIFKVVPAQYYNLTGNVINDSPLTGGSGESNLISIDKAKEVNLGGTTHPSVSNSDNTWVVSNSQVSDTGTYSFNPNKPYVFNAEVTLSPSIPPRPRPGYRRLPNTPRPITHFSHSPTGSNLIHKPRRYPIPPFMTGLMDSVANFFTRMG